MARSHISQYHPKVAKKAFRTATRDAGIRYVDAITALKQTQAQEKTLSNPSTRRNPGRMDGAQWNGDSFICTKDVDGHHLQSDIESDYEDDEYEEQNCATRRQEVSLLDMAKPMKKRGIAKHFEIVRTVQRTIPFDEGLEFEEGSECWDIMSHIGDEDSEWEEVYHEEKVEEKVKAVRPTYSAILRENR
ncbi:hypothetical protein Moror_2940 [Moniliophthora roreri MCA 2997]|uniref:Uncharacterized protein n=1 Tax=Moniliophthora roreri (strain MCA 2997) TaxID=1381753 RepID=V2XFG5_MONRO|nr:hypothetical protein Moror_2940 [Moniliophthora roreri MCA 2997]